MDSTTEFWVTGAPDADADGNGYVWDAGDLDNLAGWRTTDANQFLIVHFGIGLADVPGDDLSICSFGGPNANANVFASANGSDYVQIGALVGGTPGHLSNESFDFDGLSNVHYVKVERVATGPQTGIFFDAFGGVPVPEPASATFLAVGIGLLGLYRRSQFLRSRISG
ncbi:MAG: PEP-CTERM sorting domain-containing protein [Pirellulales bacterium]|nr:PEP-CTERM sorting domain-containing protein [Pirellulales bacterium]